MPDFITVKNEPLSIREEYEKIHKKTIVKCFNENIMKNTSMYFTCDIKYSFKKSMIRILKNDLQSKGYKNIYISLFQYISECPFGDFPDTYVSEITFGLSEKDNPNLNKYE